MPFYSMIPKKKNHIDTVFVVISALCAFGLQICAAQPWMPLAPVARILSLGCAVICVGIAGFCLSGQLLYTVERGSALRLYRTVGTDRWEDADFAVYRLRGNTKKVQARIALCSIREVERSRLQCGRKRECKGKKGQKEIKVRTQFLCPDLFPHEVIRVSSYSPDGNPDCVLLLAFDSDLFDFLQSVSKGNAEKYAYN